MTAGEDISMMDEKEHHETIHEYHSHVSGLLSSKTKDLYEAGTTDTVRGSLISGNETHMESGRDMTITGSAVASSKDTILLAGRNFKADSAEERSGSTYRESVKKRGLLSGGGLGFTMGSEKRKDRYDSEAVEQVGSTIGSVEGSVRIGAGKNAAILGSEVTAGKDIFISGENINLQHTENTYSSLEKHEMARSGLSVSLGGRTVETVHSIAAPLMRAGEVEDARLKGLYALQAGQTAGQLIREEKDAGYVVESLRHNASESANVWEKARDWDTADRIENSRLGKKNSFALDIALGSGKSTSEIESTAHVIKGSMIHGENTVSVRADKDISVSGSRIEGKDVNLEAGRHILITAGENRMEEKQNTHSTSGNMGVSLGVEGIQGIRGGYSSGKGKEEETSRTYEDSRIKAENTLTFVSGKDTAVKGGKLEGDRVKGGVGGSLSLETVQDEKSYHEESHSAGISLSYDFTHGKSGLSGGLSEENMHSHHESASSQSGIYAGDEGFDISVKDNTHLKGAVIDSKGDADKNTLRTGTLSWEDVENKADYRLSGKGIAVNKTPNAPYNEKGFTPAIPTGSSGKADSTTRAGIAPGTIMIQDKDNQRQDTTALNRNTRDSLNRLGEIFNKTKVEERQELAGLFARMADKEIGDLAAGNHWRDDDPRRAALHGLSGMITARLKGDSILSGMTAGAVMEGMQPILDRFLKENPGLREEVAILIGETVGKLAGGQKGTGEMIAWSGTKYNWLSHEQKQERDHLIAQAREDGNEALAQEVEEYYQKLDEDQERVREHLEIPENESYSPEMETAIINSNQTIRDLRERDNGYIVTVEALRLAKRQGLTEYKFGDEDFITLSGSIGSGLGVSGGFIMDRTGNIYYTIGGGMAFGVSAGVTTGKLQADTIGWNKYEFRSALSGQSFASGYSLGPILATVSVGTLFGDRELGIGTGTGLSASGTLNQVTYICNINEI